MASPVEIAFDDKHLNGMTDEDYAVFCQSWVDVYNQYSKTIEFILSQKFFPPPLDNLDFFVQEKEKPEGEEENDEGNKEDD